MAYGAYGYGEQNYGGTHVLQLFAVALDDALVAAGQTMRDLTCARTEGVGADGGTDRQGSIGRGDALVASETTSRVATALLSEALSATAGLDRTAMRGLYDAAVANDEAGRAALVNQADAEAWSAQAGRDVQRWAVAWLAASELLRGAIAATMEDGLCATDGERREARPRTHEGLGAAADADMLLYCYPQSLAATPMIELLGAGVTNAIGTVARFVFKTDGDMADGFGPGFAMYIQDDANVRNAIGAIYATRDGADNSGKLLFRTWKAGSASDKLTIDKDGLATFAGAVQVNGNTTLGDASTDMITATGRFVPRLCGSNPQHATAGSRPAGTLGEIARYGTKLYICTNASTPTWELFTSA